jgi:heme/copper-type cytochrome/quinol oxidase subunit 2
MIFWIFLILLAISVFFLVLYYKKWDNYPYNKDWIEVVSMFVLVTSALAVLIMSIFVINANVGVEGKIASNEQRYESLVYQLENEIYENDNDLGKYDLYNQIREWNEDLAKGKAMQNDFWFGIFYPDIFDKFEFIELK